MSWDVITIILIIVGIIAVIALASYFSIQSRLERKAEERAQGNEIDRQNAQDLREIASQIERGRSHVPVKFTALQLLQRHHREYSLKPY